MWAILPMLHGENRRRAAHGRNAWNAFYGWRTRWSPPPSPSGASRWRRNSAPTIPILYVVKRGGTLGHRAGNSCASLAAAEIWQANPGSRTPDLSGRRQPGLPRPVSVAPGSAPSSINAIPAVGRGLPLKGPARGRPRSKSSPYVVAIRDQFARRAGAIASTSRSGVANAQPGQRFLVVRPTVRYTHIARAGLCCDRFGKDDLDYRGRLDIDPVREVLERCGVPDKGNETLG